ILEVAGFGEDAAGRKDLLDLCNEVGSAGLTFNGRRHFRSIVVRLREDSKCDSTRHLSFARENLGGPHPSPRALPVKARGGALATSQVAPMRIRSDWDGYRARVVGTSLRQPPAAAPCPVTSHLGNSQVIGNQGRHPFVVQAGQKSSREVTGRNARTKSGGFSPLNGERAGVRGENINCRPRRTKIPRTPARTAPIDTDSIHYRGGPGSQPGGLAGNLPSLQWNCANLQSKSCLRRRWKQSCGLPKSSPMNGAARRWWRPPFQAARPNCALSSRVRARPIFRARTGSNSSPSADACCTSSPITNCSPRS